MSAHGITNSRGVLIAYLDSKSFTVKKRINNDTARILIVDVTGDDTDYILVNIYKTNTETEEIKVLKYQVENFLDTTLEAKGGFPRLKKKPVANLIRIKEHFDLCHIWRFRNYEVKQLTFR